MAAEPLAGYALVTGASSGIGAAFSRRLAAEGRALIVVARDEVRLERYAAELRARYGVTVQVLAADLSTEAGCAVVADRLANTAEPVDTLINNAGIGLHRRFDTTAIQDEQRLLNLNVGAVLRLSHAAVAAMLPRGRGEILNISSVAGFAPRGRSATYGASKAWVTAFTESLAMLLDDSGVRITAVCPGFVHTEFHQRADLEPTQLAPRWMWLDADRVVADALHDARAGKSVSVPSRRYKLLVLCCRIAPRRVLRAVMARQ